MEKLTMELQNCPKTFAIKAGRIPISGHSER
jgi:hypothetical protein